MRVKSFFSSYDSDDSEIYLLRTQGNPDNTLKKHLYIFRILDHHLRGKRSTFVSEHVLRRGFDSKSFPSHCITKQALVQINPDNFVEQALHSLYWYFSHQFWTGIAFERPLFEELRCPRFAFRQIKGLKINILLSSWA